MPETIASPEIMSERPKAIIILMRHEESDRNAERIEGVAPEDDQSRIQGFSPRTPLSGMGRVRAEASAAPGLAEFLAANKVEIVAAYTSEADRAKDSASIVLTGAGVDVPVTVDARLNEQGKGDKDLGGVESLVRSAVETPAYKAREKAEGWDFRPGVDDQPGVPESGAETPGEVSARWHSWRDDVTALIESGGLPPTNDPDATPAIFVDAHNLATAYGMGDERDMDVLESKKLYRVGNGEALIIGWDGQAWNLEGQLYRPAEPAA